MDHVGGQYAVSDDYFDQTHYMSVYFSNAVGVITTDGMPNNVPWLHALKQQTREYYSIFIIFLNYSILFFPLLLLMQHLIW